MAWGCYSAHGFHDLLVSLYVPVTLVGKSRPNHGLISPPTLRLSKRIAEEKEG